MSINYLFTISKADATDESGWVDKFGSDMSMDVRDWSQIYFVSDIPTLDDHT